MARPVELYHKTTNKIEEEKKKTKEMARFGARFLDLFVRLPGTPSSPVPGDIVGVIFLPVYWVCSGIVNFNLHFPHD